MKKTIVKCLLSILLIAYLTLTSQISMHNNIIFLSSSYVKKATWIIQNIIGTPPPSSGDWNISDITVVEYEDLIINGSIFIEYGGVLVLKNSTIRMNLAYDGEHWIDVQSGGNLTVIRSKITAYDISNNYFIRAYRGAKLRIEDSEISYAGYAWGDDIDRFGLWINTDGTIIKNSKILNNFFGITLYHSRNNVITGCDIFDSKVHNIEIHFANYNIISSCRFHKLSSGYSILRLEYSNNNYISDCSIYEGSYGLDLWRSDSNIFIHCKIYNNTHGSFLRQSNNNVISDTEIYDNINGVSLSESNYNTISVCNISQNDVGIYLYKSNGSFIFFNNFIENKNNTNSFEQTLWISTRNITYLYLDKKHINPVGNYWDNYVSIDSNGDGIGDFPYLGDTCPLIQPTWSYHICDTDSDGLNDVWENIFKTNPNSADTDGDGLTDWEEVISYKTNPTNADTDGDGIPDGQDSLPLIYNKERWGSRFLFFLVLVSTIVFSLISIALIVVKRSKYRIMSFNDLIANTEITVNVLYKVPKSRRKKFARWLSDRLVQEGKIDLATDILEGGGLYEEAASTAISQAIHYRGVGDIERAKFYYRKAAELLRRAGKATEAEEIERFIQNL